MNEPFVIPVSNQGTAYEFKARFERWGYTHRIAVLIDETTFTFEPDEKGGYRALTGKAIGKINAELLEAVAKQLARLSS